MIKNNFESCFDTLGVAVGNAGQNIIFIDDTDGQKLVHSLAVSWAFNTFAAGANPNNLFLGRVTVIEGELTRAKDAFIDPINSNYMDNFLMGRILFDKFWHYGENGFYSFPTPLIGQDGKRLAIVQTACYTLGDAPGAPTSTLGILTAHG
ncbi:MAG TPA: hypothetical protein VI522_03945, partial [Gammaproteobacteria bacterium]|nr:hypothetical protein [Gammaproteobacteria bacterium]